MKDRDPLYTAAYQSSFVLRDDELTSQERDQKMQRLLENVHTGRDFELFLLYMKEALLFTKDEQKGV